VPWSIGLGLSYGLCVGTKLNALLVGVVCVLWGGTGLFWLYLERCAVPESTRSVSESVKVYSSRLFAALRRDKKTLCSVATSVALFLCVTAVVFLALNPFLYSQPLRNTKHLIELGRLVARYDVPDDQRLDTWARRWDSLINIGLGRTGAFRYYLKWPWVDIILAGLGGLVCVRTIIWRASGPLRRNYSWFVIWLAVTMAGILYWTPFNWPRWYLPLEPCWAVLEGIGVALVLTGGHQICRRVVRLREPST
jgi:hypothetical protein